MGGKNPIHSVSDPIALNIELVVINNCEDPMTVRLGWWRPPRMEWPDEKLTWLVKEAIW